MRNRLFQLPILALLMACGTHPKATEAETPGHRMRSVRAADAVPLPADSSRKQGGAMQQSAAQIPSPTLPDTLQAALGPRKMRFHYISDADLRLMIANNDLHVDTLFGKFLLINILPNPLGPAYYSLQLLYRPNPAKTDWIQTPLELVGSRLQNWEANCQFQHADTARLGEQRASVIMITVGEVQRMRNWDGITNCVNVIDVSGKPQMLLKAENYTCENSQDGPAEELSPGRVCCQQLISLRQQKIIVGPVTGVAGGTVASELGSLPAGAYRYERGKVFRVGK